MSRSVVTLTPDMTLEQAAERFVQRGVSGAPVVDARGNLVGVLSETDILGRLKVLAEEVLGKRYLTERVHSLALLAFLGERAHGAVEEIYRRLRETRVAEAMTRRVHTARPDDSLEKLATLMIREDINRVPVVEGTKVVGIVSRADLTRVVARAPGVPRL